LDVQCSAFSFARNTNPPRFDSREGFGKLLRVDKLREPTLARTIVRATAKNMKPFRYTLTKPTFICRAYPHFIAFFHFHKFTFAPSFRLHFSIRVLNSDFRAPHLNGPSFDQLAGYREDEISVSNCAQRMAEFLIGDGLTWVESWLAPEKLISDSRSPLSEEDKASLRSAIKMRPDPKRVAFSYSLLGINK
jgi:hypothetical protein